MRQTASPLYPHQLASLPADARFALIAIDEGGELPPWALPPVPVIAVGDARGSALPDAIVQPPVTTDALVRAIDRRPRAAAVAVQLLRSTCELPPMDALVLESLAYGVLQAGEEHRAWRSSRRPVAPTSEGCVHLDRSKDLLRVTIERPDARNAIDVAMRDALYEAFTIAALDRTVSVELRSVGAAFCVGADLGEFGITTDPAEAHAIRMRTLPAIPLIACADRVSVHIQGACIGAGLEIAAFAGRVTASRRAWFQLPELAMGLIPGAGGCVSVPRRIGRQRAALMILSGRRIGADTALEWGLIDAITD